MRILAVDHGQSRIGLAITDASGIVARPLKVIYHTARKQDAESVAATAAKNGADLIVIGLPTDSNGRIGPAASTVQRFGNFLKTITDIGVEYWDESYSTQRARELLRPNRRSAKQSVDAAAAAVILQDYIDTHHAEID